MVGKDETFVNMFVGANATSKTATGANIVANICYGVQNKYFDYPLFQKFPYLKKGRIISDPTTIKEKIIPELEKWFPANEASRLPDANFETSKEGKNYVSKFKTNTGFEFDIMSNEQDVKEFESVDVGWVWIDEPMPKDRFFATLLRGRLGMVVIWTYTPLFASGWIKDWMDEHTGSEGYADYIEAEMEDNCKVHGVRGILDHSVIKKLAATVPEDEREARIFGRFGHLIGKVHKRFKRKIHVIKPFAINEKDYTVYHALDPHPRTPDHAMWMAVDRKGSKFICAELVSEGITKLLKERILNIEESRKFRVQQRIIDPSAYIDDQHQEKKSVGSRLFDLGLSYVKGSKDLMAGIKRTDDALMYEIKGGEFIQEPEIYIFDTCRVTIKQLEEYVWDDYKGRGADEREPKGRPKDKDDHMPENLHRLLLAEPTFVPFQYQRSGVVMTQGEEDLDPYAKI